MRKTGNLYTVYDRVAECASPPFLARTNGVAVRMYLNLIEQQKLDIQDYWLYKVGSWNDEEMIVFPVSKPERVKISEVNESEVVSVEGGKDERKES